MLNMNCERHSVINQLLVSSHNVLDLYLNESTCMILPFKYL